MSIDGYNLTLYNVAAEDTIRRRKLDSLKARFMASPEGVKQFQELAYFAGIPGKDGRPLSLDSDWGENTEYAWQRFSETPNRYFEISQRNRARFIDNAVPSQSVVTPVATTGGGESLITANGGLSQGEINRINEVADTCEKASKFVARAVSEGLLFSGMPAFGGIGMSTNFVPPPGGKYVLRGGKRVVESTVAPVVKKGISLLWPILGGAVTGVGRRLLSSDQSANSRNAYVSETTGVDPSKYGLNLDIDSPLPGSQKTPIWKSLLKDVPASALLLGKLIPKKLFKLSADPLYAGVIAHDIANYGTKLIIGDGEPNNGVRSLVDESKLGGVSEINLVDRGSTVFGVAKGQTGGNYAEMFNLEGVGSAGNPTFSGDRVNSLRAVKTSNTNNPAFAVRVEDRNAPGGYRVDAYDLYMLGDGGREMRKLNLSTMSEAGGATFRTWAGSMFENGMLPILDQNMNSLGTYSKPKPVQYQPPATGGSTGSQRRATEEEIKTKGEESLILKYAN